MSVKLSLNRQKLEGMYLLVAFLLDEYPPKNKADKLLHIMAEQLWIKLRNKLEQKHSSNGYKITLKDDEALAFDIWISKMALPVEKYTYEVNIVRNVCLEIDCACA